MVGMQNTLPPSNLFPLHLTSDGKGKVSVYLQEQYFYGSSFIKLGFESV